MATVKNRDLKMNIKIYVVCTVVVIAIIIATNFSSPPPAGGGLRVVFLQTSHPISFDDLLDAIEQVESGGDADAVGDWVGQSCPDGVVGCLVAHGEYRAIGAYQIHKIYIDDLNRIYKARHTDKYSSPLKWEYYHREDKVCSRIMVRDYLCYYSTEKRIGHKPTFEDMARIHNGGPNGYKKERTKKYWIKIEKELAR